jgi:hypothetical protein
MGKGHRDNHRARLKRGPEAFQKKTERRAEPRKFKCNTCGIPLALFNFSLFHLLVQ